MTALTDLACRNHDPEIWFADGREVAVIEFAKNLCADCPLRLECAQGALDRGEKFGIFGGMTPEERGIRGKKPKDQQTPTAATAARRAEVASLHRDGRTVDEIAARLEVGGDTVREDLRLIRRAETVAAWPFREQRITAALDGHVVELTRDELHEAVDRYDVDGRTLEAVSARLHCGMKVVRNRREARRVAA